MGNLKVADNEYSDLKEDYAKICEIAERQLETYFNSMNRICTSSITSGIVYKNLVSFLTEAAKIKGVLEDIGEVLGDKSENFVEDVDKKDKYLY